MPKAVKDHRNKKNPLAYEAWRHRKTLANAQDKNHLWFQKDYRQLALHERMLNDKMTDKNWDEAERLGVAKKKVVTE